MIYDVRMDAGMNATNLQGLPRLEQPNLVKSSYSLSGFCDLVLPGMGCSVVSQATMFRVGDLQGKDIHICRCKTAGV